MKLFAPSSRSWWQTRCGNPPATTVASGVQHLPFDPLKALSLGNGDTYDLERDRHGNDNRLLPPQRPQGEIRGGLPTNPLDLPATNQ